MVARTRLVLAIVAVLAAHTLAMRIQKRKAVQGVSPASTESSEKRCSTAVVNSCLEVFSEDAIDAARASVPLGMEAIPQEVDAFFSDVLGNTRFSCASMCQSMIGVGEELLGVAIPLEPEVLCMDSACEERGGNEVLKVSDQDSSAHLQEMEDKLASSLDDTGVQSGSAANNPMDAAQQVLNEIGHSEMSKVICRRLLSVVFRLFPAARAASEDGRDEPNSLLEQAAQPPVLRGFDAEFEESKPDLLLTLQRSVRATSAASRLLSKSLPAMSRAECEKHFPLYLTSDEKPLHLSEEQGTACLLALWLNMGPGGQAEPYSLPAGDVYRTVFDDLRGLRSHVAAIEALLADPLVVYTPQSPSKTIQKNYAHICGKNTMAAVIPGALNPQGDLTGQRPNMIRAFQATDTNEGSQFKIFLCPKVMTLQLHKVMTLNYIHEASHHFGTTDVKSETGVTLYHESDAMGAGASWVSRKNAQNVALFIMRLAHWEGVRHEPIVSAAEAMLEPNLCEEWGKKCDVGARIDGWLMKEVCSECRRAGPSAPVPLNCPEGYSPSADNTACVSNPASNPVPASSTVAVSGCPANSDLNPETKMCMCRAGFLPQGSACVVASSCPPNSDLNPKTMLCACRQGFSASPDGSGCQVNNRRPVQPLAPARPQPQNGPMGESRRAQDQQWCQQYTSRVATFKMMCEQQAYVLKSCANACAAIGVV